MNMREIRFRAWDKENKKMIAHSRLFRLDTSNEMPFLSLLESFEDNYMPMQFTGLKDKNGTEIYEGDIVTFESVYGGMETLEVEFCDGMFTPKGIVGWGIFGTQEVIGNVYEDPDLLGGDNK